MTRRLLAFFAPSMLAAQQEITVECKGMDCKVTKAVPRIPRPRNGECPVCGTMAPKLFFDLPESGVYRCSTDGLICIGPDESRRIDCHHCGCTFRQWAEGKEPKQ